MASLSHNADAKKTTILDSLQFRNMQNHTLGSKWCQLWNLQYASWDLCSSCTKILSVVLDSRKISSSSSCPPQEQVLRPVHNEQKRKRKRKNSWMFVAYSLIVCDFFLFFAFAVAFAWCEQILTVSLRCHGLGYFRHICWWRRQRVTGRYVADTLRSLAFHLFGNLLSDKIKDSRLARNLSICEKKTL